MKRTICVITGSRAEYGLLYPLLDTLRKDRRCTLSLVVTGMHLCPEFGSTYKEIENDGFTIRRKVRVLSSDDTVKGLASSIGKGIEKITRLLAELEPDVVVLLGDRFEIFAAAVAAHITRIPIAHIHGGELTEGVIDDAFRHAITKMASLHFTATDRYRKRIVQLGESPKTVFNVGALGLDNIRKTRLLSKEAVEKSLGLPFNKRNILITFHPVTLESGTHERQFKALLTVLDELEDTNLYFTKANADTGGRRINKLIDLYVSFRPAKARAFASLGRLRYLSLMQYVDAVVGNSSSGIIEAPSFRIGTVNIGDRQRGRIRAKSVLDCKNTTQSIRKAITTLYSPKFRSALRGVDNPYGRGNASARIAKVLKQYPLQEGVKKRFYDLSCNVKHS